MLIGHGGTQEKRAPNVLALARTLVRHLGVGAIALDAPEHGDRVSDPDAAAKVRSGLERRLAEDADERPRGVSRSWAARLAARIPGHVAEWKALIDDLEQEPAWAAGPFGYWGLSMGTSHGLPLVASEPRITAAVLGLNALRSPEDPQAELAAAITVPVLFLLQSEDELMTPRRGDGAVGRDRLSRQDPPPQSRWPHRGAAFRARGRDRVLPPSPGLNRSEGAEPATMVRWHLSISI